MITIIAELATNHGGDLDIAKRLIDDAAKAGANLVKTQAYDLAKLNPADPQAEWLTKAHLTEDDHRTLKAHAESVGITYFASAFDQKSAEFVVKLCGRVKFASSVDVLNVRSEFAIYKTYPWRCPPHMDLQVGWPLVTVPLYPTPLECIAHVDFTNAFGWSDHTVGLSACCWVLARERNISTVEVHMTTPYAARQCPWDKTPEQIRELRQWCDDLETIRTGVSTQFRERWTA